MLGSEAEIGDTPESPCTLRAVSSSHYETLPSDEEASSGVTGEDATARSRRSRNQDE